MPGTPEAALILPVRANFDAPDGQQKKDAAQAQSKPQQWEYKAVSLQRDDFRTPGGLLDYSKYADSFTDQFNKLALDGWKYHRTLYAQAGAFPGAYALFTRPKQ